MLILSIASLFAGVLALPLLRRRGEWLALLDGFVLVWVGGVVLLRVVPHSLKQGGLGAALALLVGLVLPMLLARGGSEGLRRNGELALGVAVLLGVAAHAMLEGMALSLAGLHPGHGELQALAALFHRLSMGIALGWFLWPMGKRGGTLAVVFGVGLSTGLGYVLGKGAFSKVQMGGVMLFQAMMAGVLLHVLFSHRPPSSGLLPTQGKRWSAGGAMLGLGLLGLLSWLPQPALHRATDSLTVERTLLWLALESAPALLLAFLGAGVLKAFLRPASMSWLRRGSPWSQSLRGMAFGLPLPICSCGVVPFYESLSRAGAPGAAAIAFLIATPELGIDALLISLPLLGVELTLLRLLTAIVAALVVALLVGRLCSPPTHLPAPAHGGPAQAPLGLRLKQGLRYGFVEMFDHIMPWVLVGLLLAALLEPAMPLGALAKWPPAWQVPLFALAGMPLYVCASGTTPLVAILLHKSLSPGAAIAFLLTGPATNITTFGLLRSLHGSRAALAFAGAMFAVSCSLGWLVNSAFPSAPHASSLIEAIPMLASQPDLYRWATQQGLCSILDEAQLTPAQLTLKDIQRHAIHIPFASTDQCLDLMIEHSGPWALFFETMEKQGIQQQACSLLLEHLKRFSISSADEEGIQLQATYALARLHRSP